jgi:hypothetical protein
MLQSREKQTDRFTPTLTFGPLQCWSHFVKDAGFKNLKRRRRKEGPLSLHRLILSSRHWRFFCSTR